MKLEASFMEIYNESVYDLLDSSDCEEKAKDEKRNPALVETCIPQKKLSIIESPFTNGVIVPDLKSVEIVTESQLLNLVAVVQKRRIVSPNINNNHSSR